eukprot:CCRYP_017346-RA/>CCRYP_017346-RA protein AED:0.00 eAED:0.00 QI:27/1/1/1/0/0/2/53/57
MRLKSIMSRGVPCMVKEKKRVENSGQPQVDQAMIPPHQKSHSCNPHSFGVRPNPWLD